MPKKILLLGCGYVSYPCIEYLTRSEYDNFLTVVSRKWSSVKKAYKLYKDRLNLRFVLADISDQAELEELVSDCELVISLVPYTLHPKVFEAALKLKKHVVTSSYISDAMQVYNDEAIKNNLTFFNEVGVDPGIDHIYAIKIIEEAHKRGEKVISFNSYCGGLPTPKHMNDNPLQYKFSWSSKGVLLALNNNAKFISNNEVLSVPSTSLMDYCKVFSIDYEGTKFNFIGYPNRDSSIYNSRYNIPHATDVIRGTLRYSNFPLFVRFFHLAKLLDNDPENLKHALTNIANPLPWPSLIASKLKASGSSPSDIRAAISHFPPFSSEPALLDIIMSGLSFFGILSPSSFVCGDDSIVGCLASLLQPLLTYKPNEPDLIVLVHEFILASNNSKRKLICSAFWFGDDDVNTSMAKTVGITTAVTTKLILDGVITSRGVLAPITWDLAEPIYRSLLTEGITMSEVSTPLE